MRLVAVEAVVLAVWWLWGARGEDPAATWTLFSAFNVGSVLIQFGVALVLLVALNKWLAASVDLGD
jgi:hypothetical protein